MTTHIIIQDPNNLSTRYSTHDRLGWDGDSDSEFDELIEQNLAPDIEQEIYDAEHQLKVDFGTIEKYLTRIPDREADLITLYHKDKMRQEQIAKLFGITQAAVSYRLHRGIKRIQFLRTIPELDHDQFELELGPKFQEQDREILWRMYETTCQSEIAKQMNLTQGRVRHRFFRALARIKELIAEEARERQTELQIETKRGLRKDLDEETIQREVDEAINNSRYAKYWTIYFAISDKHFNILHEVSLPQFKDRSDAQILPIE
jgi:DNA-directed RNA polymerase specialized sigma24 family protein